MKIDDLHFVRDRRNPVILDKHLRFVYFPNNKVCQTSIARQALSHRAIVKKDGKLRWHRWFKKTQKIAGDNIFSFTVVRNPFDLVVSAYFYLYSKNRLVSKYPDFDSFCKKCLSYKREKIDPHFLPQSEKLFRNGEALPDIFAHFESIYEDWPKIAARIGESNLELSHSNPSARDSSWRRYYSDESINVVRELYKEDFKTLGYGKFLKNV